MVVEQVHLVDVEDVAIRLGEHARLKAPAAGAQGRFDVDGAHDAIFGRVDRELDHPHAAFVVRQHARRLQPHPAVGAESLPVGRVAAEMAALDHVVLGEQPRQPTHRGRLAGSLLAAYEDPADRRDDRVEDEGQLHRFLADDRRERVRVAVERQAHAPEARPKIAGSAPEVKAPASNAASMSDDL